MTKFNLFRSVAIFVQKHKKSKALRGTLIGLASVTVFTTTYALILPALTLEKTEAKQMPGIDLGDEAEYDEEIVDFQDEYSEDDYLDASWNSDAAQYTASDDSGDYLIDDEDGISDDEWDEYLECDGPDDVTANARRVERILEDAWEVLVEDGCAHADDEDGHDKQAQLLKDEIEELLEKHSDPEEDDEDEDDGDPGDDEEDEDEQEDEEDGEDEGNGSIDEEEIMEHIQEMLDDNQQERADDQQLYEELYGIGVDEGSLDGMQGEVW